MAKINQDLEGIGAICVSLAIHQTSRADDLKDEDLGKAVSLVGDYEISRAYDNTVVLGKLIDISLTDADVGKRIATIQIGGIMVLPIMPDRHPPKINRPVVGNLLGSVRVATTNVLNDSRGLVIAVNEDEKECTLIL